MDSYDYEYIVSCPVTGEDIPTGIYMRSTIRADVPMPSVVGNKVYCCLCKREHTWDIVDATHRKEKMHS